MNNPVSNDTNWWKGAVIYQIYPRSFQDSNGDGVGDLRGIANRLDYVAELGVDGIWLSPFFTSPMADFGYDISDYCAVDPIFGTLEDFDAVLNQAHARGLKVIIDQVYSHTSDQHDWFGQSRKSQKGDKADWYVWADPAPDGGPPNNWLSIFSGPAWTWDSRRRQYYFHSFLSEQPDLNFHNSGVQDAVLDVARFWLDRGVDGFRLDVANHYFHDQALRDNPISGINDGRRPYEFQKHIHNRCQPENPEFLKRLRKVMDSYGSKMTVAEIASDDDMTRSLEYTQGDKLLHTAYNFEFLKTNKLSPKLIRDALENWQGVDAWPSWSFSNHDVTRVLTRWGDGDETPVRAKFLLALLLCLRGTIFLYQGEELGLPQANVPFDKLRDPEALRFWPDNMGRDGCRVPFPWSQEPELVGFSEVEPWLPIDIRQREFSVDQQIRDAASPLHYTREFLQLRRSTPALRTGGLRLIDSGSDDLLVFERYDGSARLLCAFNFSTEQSVELPIGLKRDIVVQMNLSSALIESGRDKTELAANGVLIGLTTKGSE